MSTPTPTEPRCRACSAPLTSPLGPCDSCGSAQTAAISPYAYPDQPPAPTYQPVTSAEWQQTWNHPQGQQAMQPHGASAMVIQVVNPKSVGLAVLLSFLLPGAGHLYANRVATGVVLIGTEVVLGLISLSVVGLILAIPAWCILVPASMFFSAQAVKSYNRRNGVVPR